MWARRHKLVSSRQTAGSTDACLTATLSAHRHQSQPMLTLWHLATSLTRPLLRLCGRLQTTGVHVWFVAHPRQMREWKGQPPNLYDISGSAHFINKADNGIVVHRDRDPNAPDQRQVGACGGVVGLVGWRVRMPPPVYALCVCVCLCVCAQR
jgi:hypothetical protein